MTYENLEFVRMSAEDIPVLTPVMKRAFDEDSRLYFGKPQGGPPGYDDGSFLRKWGLPPRGGDAYRVNKDGNAIGAIILFVNHERREGFLGCVFVDSTLEGQGYGSTMWRFAESTYPDIKVWRTETPAVSYRNHCFYINKLGFHVVAVEGARDDRFEAQFKLKKEL